MADAEKEFITITRPGGFLAVDTQGNSATAHEVRNADRTLLCTLDRERLLEELRKELGFFRMLGLWAEFGGMQPHESTVAEVRAGLIPSLCTSPAAIRK